NKQLRIEIDEFKKQALKQVKASLKEKIKEDNTVNILAEIIPNLDANALKDLSFQLKSEVKNLICILGSSSGSKASLSIMIDDAIVESKKLNAGAIIREAAKEINGGGGGQAFFATAGGSKPEGLHNAIKKAVELLNL
ncbi:MAG: alanine--tRNA ligase, partial [Bacteroidales bacterium]|nr:alanine--tRNA ligase [Bacteroidales bacterium]